MMKKRLLAALVCLVMVLAMLPATAYAASSDVLIGGVNVTLTTPYYFNDVGGGSCAVTDSPTYNGKDWNAYLEKNGDSTYTLYLRNFGLVTDYAKGIVTNNISTLYLVAEGNNDMIIRSYDLDAAAIVCDNLIIGGGGSLELIADNGEYAINAGDIRLQYGVSFFAHGKTGATSVRVTCSGGASMYRVDDGFYNMITDYFSNTEAFRGKTQVRFSPKADAVFPVWANGTRVTMNNSNNVLNDSNKTVKYTYAVGAAPAVLTLNNAVIDTSNISGAGEAGIYAEESLEINLQGENTISLFARAMARPNSFCSGIFLNGEELIFTAEPGASLYSDVAASAGAGQIDCYGIYAGGNLGSGNITIKGGDITACGATNSGSSYGIASDGVLSVTGGCLEAICNTNADVFAVAADSLVLGSGMKIKTPADALMPANGAAYVRDSEGNAANRVLIDTVNRTVSYDANGGVGTMAPGTATEGAAFTLPQCSFTAPAGMRFKHWAVGSASGTAVDANGTYTFTADTTVYAIWETITYTVTYDANSGSGAMAPGTAAQGAVFTLPDCEFTAPAGKRFKQWSLDITAQTLAPANGTYVFTADTTVYAMWEDIPAAEPTRYQITQGQGGEWTQGGTAGLRFTADADYGKFTGVWVDGAAISNDKYTAQSGSTIVTLNASYLQTLSVGRHTLRMSFTDGYAQTDFIIKAAEVSTAPETGDNSQSVLLPGVMLTALAGLAICLISRRRQRV